MKTSSLSRLMFIAVILLAAVTAFAGTKASVELNKPLTVHNQLLAAGRYKLAWEGQGPAVEVNILQGDKVIAKVPATVVDLKQPAVATMVGSNANTDGTASLTQVQFGGKKYALDFTGATVQTEAKK